MVAVADEDVARLDVAVHEAGRVRGVERVRDLGGRRSVRAASSAPSSISCASVVPRTRRIARYGPYSDVPAS